MVPDGWELIGLGDVCPTKNGLQTGPFGSQLHASDYVDDGIPVVMPKDMLNGRISTATIARIPPAKAEEVAKHKLEIGDIVFSRRGDLGRFAVVQKENIGWVCGTGCMRARLNDEVSPDFVFCQLSTHGTVRWLENNAVGQTMPNLNTEILSQLPLPLPPLPEQRKIAAILSTWDRAIELTERLIAAKQKRKQALMQQLLTGKVRFAEFGFPAQSADDLPKGWLRIHIEDVADINAMSLSESSTPAESEYFYIDLGSVDSGTVIMPTTRVRFADLPSRARRRMKRGDVILATVRPNLNGHFRCTFEAEEYVCSTGFAVMTPKTSTDSLFLYQFLFSQLAARQFAAILTGSNYPALNASDVCRLRIAWPQRPEEREKIGAVLDSADQEVVRLRRRAIHLQQQKKGLMQQLLTGKVRVNVDDNTTKEAVE